MPARQRIDRVSTISRGPLASSPSSPRGSAAATTASSHYRTLRPLDSRIRPEASCNLEGCGKAAVNKGLCQAHADQRKKGQQLRPPPASLWKGPCRFDGCSKPRAAGGVLCRTCRPAAQRGPLTPLRDLIDAALRAAQAVSARTTRHGGPHPGPDRPDRSGQQRSSPARHLPSSRPNGGRPSQVTGTRLRAL
jgi:hypothetical protein